MMNDRDADKASFPTQIACKVSENPFAGTQLGWHRSGDDVDLAENRQQLHQCRPISLLRTPVSGTIGQISPDSLLINIGNAKLLEFKPAAEITTQPQTPPRSWSAISLPDQPRRV